MYQDVFQPGGESHLALVQRAQDHTGRRQGPAVRSVTVVGVTADHPAPVQAPCPAAGPPHRPKKGANAPISWPRPSLPPCGWSSTEACRLGATFLRQSNEHNSPASPTWSTANTSPYRWSPPAPLATRETQAPSHHHHGGRTRGGLHGISWRGPNHHRLRWCPSKPVAVHFSPRVRPRPTGDLGAIHDEMGKIDDE